MDRRPKQTFLRRRHTDGQQAQERMLNIANYQSNQIKTTMKYHHTLVRMVSTKKSTNNKCQRGCGEKGTLLHCWWECKLVQPLWKTVWRFLKKLKLELPYDEIMNEIMPFSATWMDLEIIIVSKVSQKEKDKYHVISLICGI